GGRELVALAGDHLALRRAQGAAQAGVVVLCDCGEVGFAIKRAVDRAAHQRGAAQPGQDGAGEPLDRDTAAIGNRRATIPRNGRVIPEIDGIGRSPEATWAARSAVVQNRRPLRLRIAPVRRKPGSVANRPLHEASVASPGSTTDPLLVAR